MDLLGSHRALLFSVAPLPPKNIYLFTIIKFGGKVRILWSIIPNHKKFALKKRNGVRWTISFQMASTTSRARSSTQQHILLHTSRVTGTGRMWHRWCRLSSAPLSTVCRPSRKNEVFFTLVTMKYNSLVTTEYYTVVNIKFYTLYTAVTIKYYTVVCMALLKLRKSNCHDGKKFYPTTTLIQQNWPKNDCVFTGMVN